MGKFIKEIEPGEKEYVVQLTQSEVDMIQGIIADLLDNPQRRVRMKYEVDGAYVAPSKKGVEALKGAANAFKPISEAIDYNYYYYWGHGGGRG